MAQTIISTCPFCGKPHKVRIGSFQSVATSPPVDTLAPTPRPNFLATFLSSDIGLSISLAGATWLYTRIYDYSPVWSVVVGFGVGVGLPVLRLVLARPYLVQEKPDKVQVDVVIDDRSEGGFTRSVDGFNPDLVGWSDLLRLAHAPTFSRDGASQAGLSQSKWHKCKGEFLRLRYCVPNPNNQNGYTLTIRGRHLLEKVRTSTNNNKQQRLTS